MADDLHRLTVSLPGDLSREAARYALAQDASLAWAIRRALRLLLDEEKAQADRERLPQSRIRPNRKGTPMATVSVKLPLAERERLRKQAHKAGCSLNALCVDRLTS